MHRLYIYHLYMIYIREKEREREREREREKEREKRKQREGEREIENQQQHVYNFIVWCTTTGLKPPSSVFFTVRNPSTIVNVHCDYICIIKVGLQINSRENCIRLCKHD